MRKTRIAAALLAAACLIAAPAVAFATDEAVQTQGQPDHVCNEAGYEAKVDTAGDPATVEYTAPAGFLVDSYCVKAGQTKHIIPVTPAAASVTIDHPEKDSVSHYQVHLIPVPVEEDPDPVATPVAPTAAAGIETCVDGQSVDALGTITLPAFEGGHWAEGEGTLTDVPPGEYGFTPVIHEGYVYDGPEMLFVTVPASVDVECEVVVPPASCVGSGIWYTELDDLEPVATEGGLLFAGGSGKAVGIRTPVTGNLQGWESVSFVATGGTEQFFFRIVIDASADGGKAYQSLSFPGYTTIDSASVSYQFGESIAATAERFPNAVITSVGFQTNSGAPEGFEAVLSSMTGGCGEIDWTWPPLPEDTRVPGEWSEPVIDCESEVGDEVTITREIVITTWSRDENGQPVSSEETVTENDVYVVTEADIEALECPVVEPTPTPEPTVPAPTPAPAAQTPEPPALAATGTSLSPLVGLGALALVLAGAGITVAATRRR